MELTDKQTGVLKKMIVGMAISLAIIVCGSLLNPFSMESSASISERLSLALQWLLLPTIFLVISIGRLARHRFFTPNDIGGGGFSEDSERAKTLQALLQNTLEQFCLAVAIFLAWAVIMPGQTLSVIPLAAMAFALGRILFFIGYEGGGPSRALGFTLTFYPSALMLVGILGNLLWLQVS